MSGPDGAGARRRSFGVARRAHTQSRKGRRRSRAAAAAATAVTADHAFSVGLLLSLLLLQVVHPLLDERELRAVRPRVRVGVLLRALQILVAVVDEGAAGMHRVEPLHRVVARFAVVVPLLEVALERAH